ncbi:MAG: cyclic nucleotide-binding domain-containing protein [Proteobacteria bacterium]|nr:cyclic nucleotide-binding domain-containing protein [Pseudomonadota bacterium]MBU1709579.1 cyclic nucleotide-binding domain-containing protein [Pseudomonadota bacterium]
MNTEERVQCLKNIDLFSSFTDAELKGFAKNISEVQCAPGDILFQEGDPGNEMYILLEGELKVFKESREITIISPMDYVGEMSLIEDKPRSATVQADEPCLLLKIASEQFQYVVRQHSSMLTMMKALSQRIRRDTEIIAGEFEKANIMIHDMKNILSPFVVLDSIRKKVTDTTVQTYLGHLQDARRNLLFMMEEALANAKRLHKPSPVTTGALHTLIEELQASYFSIHPEIRDKTVVVTVKDILPLLAFCKLEIQRVITNIVLNAAQASKPGDQIEIILDSDGKSAIVRVQDHGTGIPAGLGKRIFESHFSTKSSGAGFGLASCKQIIEKKHGGTISYTSTPGKGTIFTLTLPLSPE